jgi:hypothetical protein
MIKKIVPLHIMLTLTFLTACQKPENSSYKQTSNETFQNAELSETSNGNIGDIIHENGVSGSDEAPEFYGLPKDIQKKRISMDFYNFFHMGHDITNRAYSQEIAWERKWKNNPDVSRIYLLKTRTIDTDYRDSENGKIVSIIEGPNYYVMCSPTTAMVGIKNSDSKIIYAQGLSDTVTVEENGRTPTHNESWKKICNQTYIPEQSGRDSYELNDVSEMMDHEISSE